MTSKTTSGKATTPTIEPEPDMMETMAPPTPEVEVVSVFAAEAEEAFTTYEVELSFLNKILGGTPRDPKIIEGWLRTKMGLSDEGELREMMMRTLMDLGVEVGENPTMEELETASEQIAHLKHSTGFKRDNNGLFIESRQVKACIKESVNINFAGDRWGITKKGPKAFTSERVFVDPDRIYLNRMDPDEIEMFIGHVSDKGGKRATLGYFEAVEKPIIHFQCKILDDGIKPKDWSRIWPVAERSGLGAVRSQGFGRFSVTRWEKKI